MCIHALVGMSVRYPPFALLLHLLYSTLLYITNNNTLADKIGRVIFSPQSPPPYSHVLALASVNEVSGVK